MRVRRAPGRLWFVAACALPLLGAAEPPPTDAVLFGAMRAELTRATRQLKLPSAPAPYYVAYWLVDENERSVEATLGAVVSDELTRDCFIKVELRVGTRESDNSNLALAVSTDGDPVSDSAPTAVTVDDDADAIRRDLWLATDGAYKDAVAALEKKQATRQSEIATRAEVPSFSTDTSSATIVKDPPPGVLGDPLEVARHVSAVFGSFPAVQRSSVHVLEASDKRRFLASDGGLAIEPSRFAGIEITCAGQATDGMAIERSAFLAAPENGPLPEAAALSQARRIGAELGSLQRAQSAQDYSGPVLFEGRAAAQLVYELLGESLSGTPPAELNEGMESPLARRVGKRVLPRGLTVFDDPTLTSWEGTPLLGHYVVDDEGIFGERVLLIDDGRLRNFLMSRTPRDGFAHSNGHGRSGLVGWARGRVANLIMTGKHGLSPSALRARFVQALRDEGIESGLVVEELQTRTSATSGELMPAPELAYRVALDGTETPIRGATFAPMSVRDLRDILAFGRDTAVYSFVTENDGGLDIPASIVAPSLLLEDVELRGPTTPNKRLPIVPRP